MHNSFKQPKKHFNFIVLDLLHLSFVLFFSINAEFDLSGKYILKRSILYHIDESIYSASYIHVSGKCRWLIHCAINHHLNGEIILIK